VVAIVVRSGYAAAVGVLLVVMRHLRPDSRTTRRAKNPDALRVVTIDSFGAAGLLRLRICLKDVGRNGLQRTRRLTHITLLHMARLAVYSHATSAMMTGMGMMMRGDGR
jgi:hypothetical protein